MDDSLIEALVAGLAPAHLAALVLHATGATDDQIADLLGTPRDAVAGLIEVARRKTRLVLDGVVPAHGADV